MTTAVAKKETRQQPMRPWFSRSPLQNLREEMRDMLSHAFGDEQETWPLMRIVPSLDLSETDDAVELRMDLPGMDAKDIDVQVNQNMLTVSGQRGEQSEEKGRTFHRVERRSGSFSRTITLPCPVKEDAIAAQYRDGVLTVQLPKTTEAKSRRIQVATGE
jgi:HSP20 family protein